MNKAVYVFLALAAALAVTQILDSTGRGAAVAAGDAAPALVLSDLEGRTVDLASMRGKVVAVNFWATWCAPCRMEIPELARVWQEHRSGCFELLGVVGEGGAGEIAAAAEHIPYPVLLDPALDAAETWGVGTVPQTYVVDADGRVRTIFNGAISAGELRAAVEPLLSEACPRPGGAERT